MRTVHGLQVLHRVPVVLDEDDRVRPGERETQPTDVCCQQEAVDTWVRVERLNDRVALLGVRPAVEPHVRHRRHMLLEEVRLDNVEHLLHLAEDEHAMLREGAVARLVGVHELGLRRVTGRASRDTDTAVDKELAVVNCQIERFEVDKDARRTEERGAWEHVGCR